MTRETPEEIVARLRSQPADPIRSLVDDLVRAHQPSTHWLEAWSGCGGDPVTVAWEQSSDPTAMLSLLVLLKEPSLLSIVVDADVADPAVVQEELTQERVEELCWHALFGMNDAHHRLVAAKIRSLLRTPPTLTSIDTLVSKKRTR